MVDGDEERKETRKRREESETKQSEWEGIIRPFYWAEPWKKKADGLASQRQEPGEVRRPLLWGWAFALLTGPGKRALQYGTALLLLLWGSYSVLVLKKGEMRRRILMSHNGLNQKGVRW